MKKKILVLALILCLIFIMASSVNAVSSCPNCGSPTYHNVIETRNYGFIRFVPCRYGEGHRDAEYHLWQSMHNECDECPYETQRVFFERDIILCPGEPIPYLVDPGTKPKKPPM
ncbi:hypothetical protein [Paramaledivibacter caminithermalis]|jgi:hypothetical protein|uniref:Secreted protein n=1 Tax=Paramaledivibacter caminithermalis (strain DSM 15212 / CIP 107654 / DViRD3) TaxID=1121301 RepID=A0A1M6LP30_PARC5|nr:hypothetical protein [Paramaledivibacter caminithermalis]SHJ72832.1 hypothetical protein SAMN02745912_00868 [Paramaledivibacter caminithermalis DSM 15212]